VAIDALRGEAAARAALDAAGTLVASEIVRFELLAGMRREAQPITEELFVSVHWLPIDEAVARRAGSLFREYSDHPGIDDADYLIAATALEYELQLLTRNVRHFPMLPGLEPAY
jgi:predicted nucleic acid-binding protein